MLSFSSKRAESKASLPQAVPAAPNRYSEQEVLDVIRGTAEQWVSSHLPELGSSGKDLTATVHVSAHTLSNGMVQLLGRALSAGYPELGIDFTRVDDPVPHVTVTGNLEAGNHEGSFPLWKLNLGVNLPPPETRESLVRHLVQKDSSYGACYGGNQFALRQFEAVEAGKLPKALPVFFANTFSERWNALRWSKQELTQGFRISTDASINGVAHGSINGNADPELLITCLSAPLPWALAPGCSLARMAEFAYRPILFVEIGNLDEIGSVDRQLENLTGQLIERLFGPETRITKFADLFNTTRSLWHRGLEQALQDGANRTLMRVENSDPRRLHT
jgi:hypothetical protein